MRRIHPVSEEEEEESVWGLAMPQPAFLPGSPGQETELERLHSPPAALMGHNNFVSMRGAVLALDLPTNQSGVPHPSTGDTTNSDGAAAATTTVLPRSNFSLRGELMHAYPQP